MAQLRGAELVIGVDLVPERLERARRNNVNALDLAGHDDIADAIRELTGGRGPDSVIDAVGMEAHGSPGGKLAQQMAGLLPDGVQARLIEKAGVDRLAALHLAIDVVRRGGTISLTGVYGGMADPLPMRPHRHQFFDRAGLQDTKLGQANKDDPAEVARDGFEALMAGKDRVVAGSGKNKARAAAARVLPDETKAAMHRKQSEPGSASG